MSDLTSMDRNTLEQVLGHVTGRRVADLYDAVDAMSAAEIGVLDGVTPGVALASKALVLDAAGRITTPYGVGAKNGASVVATEYGTEILHRTLLTCTATPLTFGDEADTGQFGGVKVYDFPAGLILFLGAVIDGSMTLTAPAIDTWIGDVGLGTAAPTDHASGVNAAGTALLDSVSTTIAVAKVGNIDAVSKATALTESGARHVDGTGTAIDLFLNLLIDDNGAHDNTITGAFNGTIQVTWINLGDK